MPVKPVGFSAISASSCTGSFDADAGGGGVGEPGGAVGVGVGVPAGASPYAQHPSDKARQRPVKRAQFSMFCPRGSQPPTHQQRKTVFPS